MATAKKAANKGTKSTFICNVPVRHDGEKYSKGEEIDLFAGEAEHLLASRSISAKLVPVGKTEKPAASETDSTQESTN